MVASTGKDEWAFGGGERALLLVEHNSKTERE